MSIGHGGIDQAEAIPALRCALGRGKHGGQAVLESMGMGRWTVEGELESGFGLDKSYRLKLYDHRLLLVRLFWL